MDEKIKNLLFNQAESVEVDGDMFCEIRKVIEEKEEKSMKNLFSKRKFKNIVVLATVCIVSVTCYAASKIHTYVSSSNVNDQITTFPSTQEIKKLVGFQPKFVEQFSNGFQFQNASPGDVEARDVENHVVEKAKQIGFSYEHPERKGKFLVLDATTLQGEKTVYSDTVSLGGIEAGYENVKYKFVPAENSESYITAEDRKLDEEGKLYISYGSQEVEEDLSQSICWEEDGIVYTLLDMGYEIPKDEFIEMAKEVVNK